MQNYETRRIRIVLIALFDFIEFYNRQRIQTRFQHLSPMDFEKAIGYEPVSTKPGQAQLPGSWQREKQSPP
jgi:Integrase core domain